MLDGKSILITGGTSEFGHLLLESIIREFPMVNRLVVLSRDEHKQAAMARKFPQVGGAPTRYFLGDVRDLDRLKMALEGIDVVVHAAALRGEEAGEYNPFEFARTNVGGAENVIKAVLSQNVSDVLYVNNAGGRWENSLAGASLLMAERLFVAANNMKGDRSTKFSVVRCTGPRSKASLDASVAQVLKALSTHQGGEIFEVGGKK